MQQVKVNKGEFIFQEGIERRIEYYFFKRIMDILCSLIGLIILTPLFLIVGILIRLESKGSIIFSRRGLVKTVMYLKCTNLDLWLLMLRS